MDFIENLCVNCFGELTEGSVCKNCGFDNDTEQGMMYLPYKTVLNQRYVTGNVLSHESDAATYIGYDLERETTVIIREFLPKKIANRLEGNKEIHVRERFRKNYDGYKNSFIKLWKTLKGLNNLSAVIPVLDVFEENETAYAISEKMETLSLREFLLRTEENRVSWERARLMFMPVLTAIENLHNNGIIHGGINPDNLLLCRDGKVRFAGFCIENCNVITSDLEFNVADGYTAIEQYDNNHKLCPATDIYAFSACIYRALVGTNPPDAPSRETNDKLMIPNRIAETIPPHVIKALGGGLQIYPEKRIQNIYDFRELLNAAPAVVAKAAEQETPEPVREEKPEDLESRRDERKKEKAEKEAKKKKAKIIVIILLIVALVAGGVYLVAFSGLINLKGEETTATTLKSVEVPNFSNMGYTESDVQNNGAWNEQFKITFEYKYSTDTEEGTIFKQSVAAGETVSEGTAIVLTVSKGIETVKVPDVGGLTGEEAQKTLEDQGFSVQVVEVYNSGSYTVGTVKSQGGIAPAAGEEIAKGSEVMIQVYGEVVTTTEPTTETTTEVLQ